MPLRRLLARTSAVYAVVCAALWPVPVLGLLHAESSAVVAAVGCLVAAVGSIGVLRAGERVAAVARAHLAALVVPLAMLLLSMLWRPNCGWLQGLGLFALLVPPSVLFGLGVAVAVTGRGLRAPRVTATLVVLAVAIAGVVFDLGFHPQLFTYSHVFGGVLGPIYDQELAVRTGLVAAKGQTLLWATALVLVGRWRPGRRRVATAGIVTLAALGASYGLAQPLGIVQTARGIERVLSARVDLGPVVLHLDPETPVAERRRLADEALFRFDTLVETLGARPDRPVELYLYPDPDTKADLIGSRRTGVVPVWLATPQVHMLAEDVPRILSHELVHVVAREFGMPLVRASPAVGLVEGLAVALEAPTGWPDAAALVRAGTTLPDSLGGLPDPATVVVQTMSPGGFWTAPGGVAYTANGAFVSWLLDAFGPEPLKEAYRTGQFRAAYGRDLGSLAREWSDSLAARPLDPEAVAVAQWMFSQPSLFEVRCPHHVPPAARLARDGAEAWREGRVARARQAFDAAVAVDPLRLAALDGHVAATLAETGRLPSGALDRARALADSVPTAATVSHLADVLRLSGRPADMLYRAAADSLAPVDALGRLLLSRRAALSRRDLARWLAAPPDSVPDGLADAAPVLAALRHAAADRPDRAWRIARTWCADAFVGAEASRVGRLLQARMAVRAGAFDAAETLLDGLGDAFQADGPTAYAAVARDLSARLRWHRRRARTATSHPSIFGPPPPAVDALDPRCPGPARDGVRRAGR